MHTPQELLDAIYYNNYLFESFFDDFDSPATFFFLLGAPIPPAGSTSGPDHVWILAFGYDKFVELNETSGGSKTGSM